MPKRIQPLTDVQVKNAKPKKKEYKLSDGFGLHLLVTPTGGKLWRFQYRYADKQKVLAFGAYPTVSLSEAREKREAARKQLTNGIDPSAIKKAEKAARGEQVSNSFEAVARGWLTKFSKKWSPGHADTIMLCLGKEVFPYIGARPIGEITPPDMLAVLRRMESRGAVGTAHRVRNHCSQIFCYAVASGLAQRDPSADLRGALSSVKYDHFAAITDPQELAPLLRAIDNYQGFFVVKCALRLLPLLFVRPGELRQAEWSEIDFDAEQWNIPGEKMKMRLPHIVPLSRQAVVIFRELQPLTGHSKYVFPSGRSFIEPMSNSAINSALRRMGYGKDVITGHGFRATARTIIDEVLQIRPDFIEHQLAHAVRDPNGRAYNRTAFLDERRKMMQLWSDYLDRLKSGAKVIPLKRQKAE
jgi:integrase